MRSASEQLVELHIKGMSCANCALRIEKALLKNPAIQSAVVNFSLEAAQVRFADITIAEIFEQINKLGYQAQLVKCDGEFLSAAEESPTKVVFAGLLALPFLAAMAAHFFPKNQVIGFVSFLGHPLLQLLLALPTVVWLALPFYRGAIVSLASGIANMDVLVSLGVISSFLYSVYLTSVTAPEKWLQLSLYYETSVILVALILLGKWLEKHTRKHSADAIKSLLALQPTLARKVVERQIVEIPAGELKTHDLVIVQPGERLPIDGTVEQGCSSVDESLLTGESIPVVKTSGDLVSAGSLNLDGVLWVRASCDGTASRLRQLIHLVTLAQMERSPLQKLADKIAAWFVPLVVLLSIVVGFAWYFKGIAVAKAFEHAIAVLVISCPCALGLATPLSVMAATGAAAQRGILFRNAEAIERAAKVRQIFFDKTGTLTEGKIVVKEFHPTPEIPKEQAIFLAGVVESLSEHPLAKAIVCFARQHSPYLENMPPVQDFRTSPGGGVQAKVLLQGQTVTVLVGTEFFLKQQGVNFSQTPPPFSQALVAVNGTYGGGFEFMDLMREVAKEVVQQLQQKKFHLAILSGDREYAVQQVAQALGISHYQHSLAPEQKAAMVKQGKSAMVGDGINDAPALASAWLGIAVLAPGSSLNIAAEAAHVVLLADFFKELPRVFEIAHRTMANIRQNYFWAFFYNSLAIPLAALGFLSPLVAATVMSLSSLTVVLNALRLKKSNKIKFSF